MTKQEFIDRAVEIAKARGKRVDAVSRGAARGLLRIWFNETSGKYLHELHLAALYSTLKKRGLSDSELNSAIEAVAPGRPCTHVGMRAIYEEIHAAP